MVNAGVSGYSFDQTVLRTERLAARLKPPVIVTSFTAADIPRSELKVAWSREKPYFAVTDGRLELRNVPVPTSPGASAALPVAARLLGWSMLADEVAQQLRAIQGSLVLRRSAGVAARHRRDRRLPADDQTRGAGRAGHGRGPVQPRRLAAGRGRNGADHALGPPRCSAARPTRG